MFFPKFFTKEEEKRGRAGAGVGAGIGTPGLEQLFPRGPYLEALNLFVLKKYQWGPNAILKPREEKTLLEKDFKSFLVFVFLKTDVPDVSVFLDLYGEGSIDIFLSPKELKELGMVHPNASSPYITRYDDTNKVYVAYYTPNPWIPWNGFARLSMVNPTFEEAKYYMIAWLLELKW